MASAPGTPAVVSSPSTAQVALTWSNNGPYTALRVERQLWNGTSWGATAVVASVATTATSYTDNSCGADSDYRYRIVGVASGTDYPSAWVEVHTIIPPPTQLNAVRDPTNITVSWTVVSASSKVRYLIYQDGTYKGATAAGATSFTYAVGAPGGSLVIKVEAAPVAGVVAPSPAASASLSVRTPRKPNPPTVTLPAAANVALPITVGVQQNHAGDYYARASAQLRWRQIGGSTWTTVSLGATGGYTIPGGTLTGGVDYEFQATTTTAWPFTSDWSASVILAGAVKPTVTITAPSNGSTVATGAITATWTYADTYSRPQIGWEAEITAGGSTTASGSGTGTGTSWATGPVLSNGTSYTLRVRAQNNAGLWSEWVSVVFTTSFPLPPAPTVTPVFDRDTGTVTLTITNPAPGGGQAAAVQNRVFRGEVLVADGVALNSAWVDAYGAALNVTVPYVVQAVTAASATANTAVNVSTALGDRKWFFLNGGPDMSILARLREQATASATPDLEGAKVWFEGRSLPVLYDGLGYTNAVRVAGEVRGMPGSPDDPDLIGTWEPFAALAALPGPVWYRDPLGRSFLAKAEGWSIVHDSQGPEASVTFTVTQVDPS